MKRHSTFWDKSLLFLFFVLLAGPASNSSGAMNDYCVSPPFVAQSIPPNVLINLDNSGSMCERAYDGSYTPSQFSNGLYYGYFDGTKNYRYNGTDWEVTTAAMTTGTVTNPIANGSFLNWATMRRTEVSKKLLIGGKASPRIYSAGNPVKLYAQTDCYNNDNTFNKDFNTSTGDLIYPFVGDYWFQNKNGIFNITAKTSTVTNIARPNSDVSFNTAWPTGWREYPVSGSTIAYTKVYESTPDGTTTYIENQNSSDPVIMGFTYTGTEPAGTISVQVSIRAKKSSTSTITRRIQGVLRINGTDYVSANSDINSSWNTYTYTWAVNPTTGAAWTWDEIKNLNGFGVKASSNYSGTPYIQVTQIYLSAVISIPDGGPYNIIVNQGTTNATGLIDNLKNDVRFGLGYYNTDNGGRVVKEIGFKSTADMITSISSLTPSTWTPLGETLHEMVRYFRQDAPYYSTGDYTVGSGNFTGTDIYRDPYAYKFKDVDTNATNMYVPCAKSFILFLTDGESTQDQSMPGSSTTSPYGACTSTNLKACSGYGGTPNNPNPRFAGTTIGTTYPSSGTDYMIDVAYWARTNDMRPGTETDVPVTWRKSLPGTQNIYLYPVFMFGTGSTMLKDVSIYGGFTDLNGNNKPDCTTIPGECYKDSDGDGVIESNGDDLPLTYFEGNDGYALEQNIKDAISDIVKRAASSTAVSVLSSSEGSGANIVQSLFYPKRSFSSSVEITWTSDLMNYWYYFDPYFKNAQIREDTIRDDADYTLLDLKTDYITQFYFDAGQQKTVAARCQDTDADGDCDTTIDTVAIEDAKAIWRAGVDLWWTDPADRLIYTPRLNGYTPVTGDLPNLMTFNIANRSLLDDYLGQTASADAADATINYVRGTDQDKLCATSRIPCSTDADCGGTVGSCETTRSRTVPMKVCSISKMPCTTSLDCSATGGLCEEETHTWKLGDVVSSTPRIMGPAPINNYNILPPLGYGDLTYKDFVSTTAYKSRERVFVGANDGMFHAFKLGKVLQRWSGKKWWQPGKLEGVTGSGGVGTESWAFIPNNVLPYLQYLSKPDYCHVYMVDGPIFLTDASVSNAASTATTNCSDTNYWECAKQTTTTSTSWRSIAIGSMGIGGGTCSTVDTDRITTPLNVGGIPVGWSSYFALDVTDQDNPALLWEFSNPDLGVTNVGPAIVKVGNQKRCVSDNTSCSLNSDCGVNGKCVDENGRWFAILASGSTGPISTNTKDFKGTSDQNLKLFIIDLKTGALLRTIDTGITNAFAGSISTNSIDIEKSSPSVAGNYQDDVVYIGYVKNTTSGGVLRLVINDDINPANWTTSKVIDNIGPVTTSVANLLDRKNKKLWLYFAEGRYFHKQDDLTTTRRLYGIQEPCYVDDLLTTAVDYDVRASCTSSLTLTNLQNTDATAITDPKGWYVTLDPSSSTVGAERVISNPTADTLGAIYFLSFAPTSDICGFGGTTYLWAMDYKTGNKVTYVMQGKALVQVSTGEIKELDLSDATTFSTRNNRRTVGFQGIPPTGQGLMVITNPSPIKKFMHVQEE